MLPRKLLLDEVWWELERDTVDQVSPSSSFPLSVTKLLGSDDWDSSCGAQRDSLASSCVETTCVGRADVSTCVRETSWNDGSNMKNKERNGYPWLCDYLSLLQEFEKPHCAGAWHRQIRISGCKILLSLSDHSHYMEEILVHPLITASHFPDYSEINISTWVCVHGRRGGARLTRAGRCVNMVRGVGRGIYDQTTVTRVTY